MGHRGGTSVYGIDSSKELQVTRPGRIAVPRPVRRVSRLAAISASVAILMVLTPVGCSFGPRLEFGTFRNPFAADSPWRQIIAANPAVDPNSAAMIASVQPEPGFFANLVDYAIPIYKSSSNTPGYTVRCTQEWGTCPFEGRTVSIPNGAGPHSGADGAMVTVDENTSTTFEFWQAAKRGVRDWSASWGAVNSLRGSGWGGVSTGSGASRLGGVIRIAEIAAGNIPHALALQTDNACNTFRAPALKSDGQSNRHDCIPEGARLQLDPSVDLSTMGLSPGELAVARAMQRYGGYIMDRSGAHLSVSFELDTNAPTGELGETYKDAGFRWDYDAMERVPWDKLRVLQ